MSKNRIDLINRAFAKLDKNGDGNILKIVYCIVILNFLKIY